MRKKKILSLTIMSVSFAAALFTANEVRNVSTNEELLLSQNVEALNFDVGEWWGRKDYDCVAVTCQCIAMKYQSNAADFVGEGKGSVAHVWSCRGCGSCGFTVN